MRSKAIQAKTRAISYIRVSTDKQADLGVSLEAQRAKNLNYADLYDIQIITEHVDSGESARTLDRPGLQEALNELRTGKANALLVTKLDRLTRSVKDLGILLDSYFSTEATALISVQEQLDTRSAGGRLVLNILTSVSQWEREIISERTKSAMAFMREELQYTGGRAPYGWSIAEDQKTLVPNQEEQEMIILAKGLREQGLSLRAVGRELKKQGYLPRNKADEWEAGCVKVLLRAIPAQ